MRQRELLGSIWVRKRFVVVVPSVNMRPGWRDVMTGASDVLPVTADPAIFGSAIRGVLARSETLPTPPVGPDNFDEELAHRFGLKNARGFYAGVKLVWLDETDGWLTCKPSRHRRGFDYDAFPEHWSGKESVRAASNASDADWGTAAFEALKRSVG